MATTDFHSDSPYPAAEAHLPGTIMRDRGVVRRWLDGCAERRRSRLVRPRNRRRLAQWLRRTAKDSKNRNWTSRRPDLLLRYRAAAVRVELLEVAALLEQSRDPDPACVKEVHELLANGDSPLYHPGVHVSELYAVLYYIRAGLVRDQPDHKSIDGAPRGAVREQRTPR